MKKKMAKIGEKAGLKEKEVKNLTKIGISGLLAVTLSAFTGVSQTVTAGDNTAPQEINNKQQNDKKLQERCNLKPEGGPCKGLFWKYYFNPKTGKCEEFVHGGCEGVVPFETKEECQKECTSDISQPALPGNDCGPFPNYPCGTKYFTVSLNDFIEFQR